MVQKAETAGDIQSLTSSGYGCVVLFTAQWAGETCAGMQELIQTLSAEHPRLQFVEVDADSLPDAASNLQITAVPCVVLFDGSGRCVMRVQGASATDVTDAVSQLSSGKLHAQQHNDTSVDGNTPQGSTDTHKQVPSVDERIDTLLDGGGVLLFMKGSRSAPRCGYSRRVVEALDRAGLLSYKSFDILQDEGVRQRLKERSGWNLYPQVYVNGELIGGCDIVEELEKQGELCNELGLTNTKSGNARVQQLIDQSRHDGSVLVFMKGTPDAPRCGFSKRTIHAIRNAGSFKLHHVDVLQDDDIREGVKHVNDWPTIPQVVAGGTFVGGCDVVETLSQQGTLKQAIEDELKGGREE